MPQNSNEKHQLCMTILNSQEGQTVEREQERGDEQERGVEQERG